MLLFLHLRWRIRKCQRLSRPSSVCIACVVDSDTSCHLLCDDLDVLVAYLNRLQTVNALNFLDNVRVHGIKSADTENIRRCFRTVGELLALLYVCAFLDVYLECIRNAGGACFAGFVVNDGDLLGTLDLFYVDCAVKVGEYRGLLRASCLEDFFDSGKTLSDVAAGDTAGVERSHGKLCAGFTDGLSRDDTDGFAYTDRHFGCKVRAVAVYAAAVLCAAIDDGADMDGGDSRINDALCVVFGHHCVVGDDDSARIRVDNVADRISADKAVGKRLDHFFLAVGQDIDDLGVPRGRADRGSFLL